MTNEQKKFDAYDLQTEIGKAGLTNGQVCDEAGINKNTFSNWKRDSSTANPKLVDKAIAAYEKLSQKKYKK